MTTTPDTKLMPARHGKEVRDVAIFESRTGRGPRAWDEMSEIDREILLEKVRQRRKAQARKRAVINERNGMWFSR